MLTSGRCPWQTAPAEKEGRKEGEEKGERRGRSVPKSPAASGTHAQKEQHVTAAWSKNKQAAKRKRLSQRRKRKGKRSHSPLLQRLNLAFSGKETTESLKQEPLLGTQAFLDTPPAAVSIPLLNHHSDTSALGPLEHRRAHGSHSVIHNCGWRCVLLR